MIKWVNSMTSGINVHVSLQCHCRHAIVAAMTLGLQNATWLCMHSKL